METVSTAIESPEGTADHQVLRARAQPGFLSDLSRNAYVTNIRVIREMMGIEAAATTNCDVSDHFGWQLVKIRMAAEPAPRLRVAW